MAALNPTNSAEAARQRVILSLHPAIRQFVLEVNEMGAAVEARDLDRVVRCWQKVKDAESAYLEEWER